MRVITFARIGILARILSPNQFGVFGLATLILSFIEIITETGINIFLIQQNDDVKKYINTAWIVSIIRGVLISIIIAASSPFIASFFNTPSASGLLLLTSLVPLIRGFINPSVVKFQKDLKFDKEFYFRFSIFLIEAIGVTILAMLTRSEISLVIGLIISAMIEVIMSFKIIKPIPILAFNKDIFKLIIKRGKWVSIAGVTHYLFQNIDDILIGKLLGTTSLGFYQMAYKISILPITEISDVIARVAFPIFVKISDDQIRLRKAFLKTLAAISFLSLGLGVISLIFTKEIVTILLGDEWLPILPFLKILIVFGVVRAISGAPSMLFLAIKKQEYTSYFTTGSLIILLILIVPFVTTQGIIGASLASLYAAIAIVPVMIYYTYKVLYTDKFYKNTKNE